METAQKRRTRCSSASAGFPRSLLNTEWPNDGTEERRVQKTRSPEAARPLYGTVNESASRISGGARNRTTEGFAYFSASIASQASSMQERAFKLRG